ASPVISPAVAVWIAAAFAPKVTLVALARLLPVIVTTLPPVSGPVFGRSELVDGAATNSYAPMSQAAPCGRTAPRWSKGKLGAPQKAPVGIWSTAELLAGSAMVSVGPPLFASAPSCGLVLLKLVPPNPQLVPSSRL